MRNCSNPASNGKLNACYVYARPFLRTIHQLPGTQLSRRQGEVDRHMRGNPKIWGC